MLICITINVVLNLLILMAYNNCEKEINWHDCGTVKFGFEDAAGTFYTISALLLTIYSSLIIVYFYVMWRIMTMLQTAYPDLYKQSRLKLIIFMLVYESFLLFRALNYYFFEYDFNYGTR